MGNNVSIDAPEGVSMSVLRAELLRLGKGRREMEVALWTEDELENNLEQLSKRCMKPHDGFIPVPALTIDHLPVGWKYPQILATVKEICHRTVRLYVGNTDINRPEQFCLPDMKGGRLGTGFLISNIASLVNSEGQPCPIPNCRKCCNKATVSGNFVIQTAAHVVFGDYEAGSTSVEFFYDEYRKTVVRAAGVQVLRDDVDRDMCYFTCVFHDDGWRGKMQPLQQEASADLSSLLETLSKHSANLKPFGFVVSHPHGRAKTVTFGKLKDLSTDDPKSEGTQSDSEVRYHDFASYIRSAVVCDNLLYDIPTCPGSSGAPVIVIRFVNGLWKIIIAAHRGVCEETNHNQSGYALEKLLMDVKEWTQTSDQTAQQKGTYTEEYELGEQKCRESFDKCERNPGHQGFIPVTKLTVDDLPTEWRHPHNVALIKQICIRTVRLVVGFTSPNRPDGAAFASMRGTYKSRLGAGFLVSKLEGGSQPCPFTNCPFTDEPHAVSHDFLIFTTPNIVYDTYEAQYTTAEFFYDDEGNRDSVVTAWGIEVVNNYAPGTTIIMKCISHDLQWRNKLKRSFVRAFPVDVSSMLPAFDAYPRPTEHTTLSPFAILVSHPHGTAKTVSFGRIGPLRGDPVQRDAKRDRDVLKHYNMMGFQNIAKHIDSICIVDPFQHDVPVCEGSEGALLVYFQYVGGRLRIIVASHHRCLYSPKAGECGWGYNIDLSSGALQAFWETFSE